MAKDWISAALVQKAQSTAHLYVPTPTFGFGWWFAYFWKERGTRSNDTGAREAALKDILAVVFGSQFTPDEAKESASFKVKRDAGKRVADAFTAPLPEPTDLRTNAAVYRQLLLNVMSVGFREMPTQSLITMDPAKARTMFRDLIEVDRQGFRQPVALAYRGETRDFDTVVQHRGATPRSQLGRIAQMNMEAPWHPFSDPVVAGRSYARGSSGDNCLYSVNSVADSLDIPVGFPLIEDENIYAVPKPRVVGSNDVSSWNFAMLREARQSALAPALNTAVQSRSRLVLAKCSIGGVPGKTSGIFMASENWIYAIRLTSAMHTQEFVEGEFRMQKGQCVERGMGTVTLAHYVAGAHVRRVHHGPARTCGVTGFVQKRCFQMGGRWYDNASAAELAAAHFNNDATAGLAALNIINGHFGTGPAPQAVLGEVVPAMASVPGLTVQAIEQWDLTIEQLNLHTAKLGAALYYAPFVP